MRAALCAFYVAKHFDLFPDNKNKSIINTQTSVCHIWENKRVRRKERRLGNKLWLFVVYWFAPFLAECVFDGNFTISAYKPMRYGKI